jgi:two-component system, NarL family, nitrate/nitrite response regulator NarL
MADRIRIAVIDDHPLFREGVANTLRSNHAFEVMAEGNSADDAVRIAEVERPDIILLDVSMPGGGIEAVRVIARVCPGAKTIMLTVSESDEHVAAALEAGASGYILKGIRGPELVRIVAAIHGGESYVSPALAARLLVQLTQAAPSNPVKHVFTVLTPREEQILAHVSRGQTNKEIARALALSEKTVKHYMTNIMQKLQVRNRVEAVLAMRQRSIA